MRDRIAKSILGLAIIVLGVLLLAENFGYIESIRLGDWWWTAFIIVPCLSSIVKFGFHVHNVLGLLIGVWLLTDRLDLLPEDYFRQAFWPAVLVVVGLSLLLGGFGKRKFYSSKVTYTDMNVPKNGIDINDKIEYVAVFSSYAAKNNTQSLSGGEVTSVFGGIDVDLSEANITRDIKLEVTGVFGSSIVRMPRNANIVVNRTPVFGRCSSNYSNNGPVEAPTIYVDATAVFGSVEIL